jgi:hypothetical protein
MDQCSNHFHGLRIGIVLTILMATTSVRAESPAQDRPRPQIRGILYNEDDSNRFGFDPPGKMKPERLDQLVDELADTQVTIMLICCNAQKTAYDSRAWEVHCKGFDPTKDSHQSYFDGLPEKQKAGARRWPHNQRALLDAGVDPVQRMLDRCRQRKISPWVSVRMNDVHDAPLLKSPLHSQFWMEHPEYWRYQDRFTTWTDRCLNYGLAPVRDHMLALIREVCQRYDMDGLELDWNRFPLHFCEGEEIEKGQVLTEWMGEVRKVVQTAEKQRRHPIWLAVRVPARPEVALGTGLDAVSWAKHGLIDHLIVAPFFATTDFDIPVERWIELLQGTGVGVTAGLESRVQPYPGGPTVPNTPERRRGAAMAALARGSQGIYVFNYFDVGRQMPRLLKEMHSVQTLEHTNRNYVVTFTDINIPGKPISTALPKRLAPKESAEFTLYIGPKPVPGTCGQVQLQLASEHPQDKGLVQIQLNGHMAADVNPTFGCDTFREGFNTVRVVNVGTTFLKVQSVEIALRIASQ